MNPDLTRLHPYPFERLRELFGSKPGNPAYSPIGMHIGEPKHATPEFIREAMRGAMAGLSSYPSTLGVEDLRDAIADWLVLRYGIHRPNPATQIIPVSGTREALFAIAQTVVDRTRLGAAVLCPNPFYQIYEGAALLAGAEPLYANIDDQFGQNVSYQHVAPQQWSRIQLVYVCSPGNPTGAVVTLDQWRELFELSDRHGFVIVADECYSEIYVGETAPLGALQACQALGRDNFERVIVFSSLSKRSNVPGLRSGFVAGDAQIIRSFLLYRTYHGCALSLTVQRASAAAWRDEAHVVENRRLYRQKFSEVTPLVQSALVTRIPEAGFYLWASTPNSDTEFAQRLYAEYNLTVLPGSYLARHSHGTNPGADHVRIALVASPSECLEAAGRIVSFTRSLQ
jgi:N-succinyldiaminopimelate aminotransferase